MRIIFVSLIFYICLAYDCEMVYKTLIEDSYGVYNSKKIKDFKKNVVEFGVFYEKCLNSSLDLYHRYLCYCQFIAIVEKYKNELLEENVELPYEKYHKDLERLTMNTYHWSNLIFSPVFKILKDETLDFDKFDLDELNEFKGKTFRIHCVVSAFFGTKDMSYLQHLQYLEDRNNFINKYFSEDLRSF